MRKARPWGLSIHVHVLKRLVTVWLLLSAIIGVVVYRAETQKIDSYVMEFVAREFHSLTDANLRLLNRSPAERLVLQEKVADFLKSRFIAVELYDHGKTRVSSGANPAWGAVAQQLGLHGGGLALGDSPTYRLLHLGQDAFLQVAMPLRESDDTLAGYFKGVYQVDPEILESVRQRILRSLVLVLSATFVTAGAFYPLILWLNRGVIGISNELLKADLELMEVLGCAVAKRDSDTHAHNYRVTYYAIRLAEALSLPSSSIRHLIAGAFLHDVGKIGISDTILLKPGRLTGEEFSVMRTHVALGAEIVSKSHLLEGARDVVEFHHEKYDGSGYLQGLKEEGIPLNARIFAVVDVFDALTSKRPYKEPIPFDPVMEIIREGSGQHFDPALVIVFETIAAGLYEEINSATDAEVAAILNGLTSKYFNQSVWLEWLASNMRELTTRKLEQAPS
ncbi:MAG: HD-GYP domain-containing protein [Burkholderiales bacterium]